MLKCTGAGPKDCTDNKCNPIGYVFDAVLGCKSCELILPNCLRCTSGSCD